MSSHKTQERSPLTFGGRGKRQSLSQKSGRQGQLLFEQWALQHGLVANPCPHDYGIDYFCQVLMASENGTEEIRGEVLAVQVRSVMGGARPRIKLDKVDAESALRLESPYVLVAVNTVTKEVLYRFLDSAFATRLATFIGASEAEVTLRLDSSDFRSDGFREAISEKCRPGVQHRLRIYCAELCVRNEIGGARLQITHRADSGFALVEVPWASSIFHVQPEREDYFRRLVFEEGKFPRPGSDGITLQPSLYRFLEVAGTDSMTVRGVFEHAVDGFIELAGQRKPISFRVRTAGNEKAFVSECGLVLAISDCEQDASGAYYHKMRTSLSREFGRTFDDFADFDAAIRLLKPGAKIGLGDVSTQAFDASTWGPSLENLGVGYEHTLAALSYAGISLSKVQLADLMNDEFARSIAVLAAFASGVTLPNFLPMLLVGPAAEDPNYQNRLEAVSFEVPLVMNVKDIGVVIWIRGEGTIYVSENRDICGFGAVKQTDHRVDLRDKTYQIASGAPEVWVCKHWPAVPLLEERPEMSTWTSGHEHELDGRLEPTEARVSKGGVVPSAT